MIRTIIVVIFVVIFLIISLPIMLVEWIIGKFNRPLRDKSSLAIVAWAFRVVLFLSGVKLTRIGTENIPKDTAVLYVGNHNSFFDIVSTYGYMKNLCGYISKKEMLKVPILSIWMKYLYCLFLDRSDIKAGMKTILTAIEQVKNGISIFVFPEGTRNKTPDSMLPFHEGSFKIATKSGCPIIPVTINNSANILENHFPRIKKTHVVIEYGTPVQISDLSPEDKKHVGSYVQNIIAETYKKNEALV